VRTITEIIPIAVLSVGGMHHALHPRRSPFIFPKDILSHIKPSDMRCGSFAEF
jgi:hypothetical protein